jgi:membrane-associated phospholipid phosphatase
MIEIIRKNRFFTVPYLIFILIATFCLVFFSKDRIHIYLNQINSSFADVFFKYVTYLGNGFTVAVFIVLLLFIKYRYFLIMLGNVFITTVVVQVLKRVIFAETLRPTKYFSGIYDLHLVDGVKMHSFNSFPSGHTATAFGLFFMAALISKNNWLKLLFFVLALLAAYSRVYLSQHFLVDIYFASIISVAFTFFMYYWGTTWKNPKLDNALFRKSEEMI